MESPLKTNRLSIVSLISGLIVLISLGLYWVLSSIAFPSSPEISPEPTSRAITAIMDITVPIRNLCALIALVTGILGLREIKQNNGIEKGKPLAWVGVALGSAWILFGILTGLFFLLAEILHLDPEDRIR